MNRKYHICCDLQAPSAHHPQEQICRGSVLREGSAMSKKLMRLRLKRARRLTKTLLHVAASKAGRPSLPGTFGPASGGRSFTAEEIKAWEKKNVVD